MMSHLLALALAAAAVVPPKLPVAPTMPDRARKSVEATSAAARPPGEERPAAEEKPEPRAAAPGGALPARPPARPVAPSPGEPSGGEPQPGTSSEASSGASSTTGREAPPSPPPILPPPRRMEAVPEGGGPLRRLGSLQGGEPLGPGGTIVSFTAGYTTLSATFAQGFSAGADYGAQLELDWRTTEVVAAGLWRQTVWRSGPLLLAWRVRGGFYGDLGSTWSVTSNRSDGGFQVRPGLAASARLAGDHLFSLAVDAPFDFTFSRGGGFATGLRAAASFETALQRDVAVGLRAGGGALWSVGGAPFANESPIGLIDISVLLTYQFL